MTVADSVDQKEAQTIAEVYFAYFLIGCGAVDEPELRESEWHLVPRFGIAGHPGDVPIRVDTRTGGVAMQGAPSFKSLTEFQQAVRELER